ncbi:MAG: C_GCAxxG_C_C family protein [Desulfatiglans sp.]|jgi:C_GCAxxG_C_C family probable redox protein|nr:C_GCAxxG_C_C family protein [Desulfatiglans sp.]
MTEMRITKYPEQFKKIAEELGASYGPEFQGCAQVVAGTLMEILGIVNDQVLLAASFFAGGSKRCLTCGAISGGLIILGIKYGPGKKEDGAEEKEEAVNPAMELIDRFINEYHTISCCELTGFDFRDPVQFQAFKDSPEARQKCTEKMSRVCGWVAEIISRRDNQTS